MNNKEYLKRAIRNSPIKWKQGFAMLPSELLFRSDLSRSCLVVFWVLTMHLFKGKEFCYPSIKTIATESHSSSPTVIKALKELKKAGYLEIDSDRKSGKPNKYYLKVVANK